MSNFEFPPLLEPDTSKRKVPDGFRRYIVRDWTRVLSGKALGVNLGRAVHPMFDPEQLVFTLDVGYTLRERRPTKPGQISRVLLPQSFEVPAEVLAMRAKPVEDKIVPIVPFAPLNFREEELPPGAPEGLRAVTFVLPEMVVSGVAERFVIHETGLGFSGHELQTRFSNVYNEPSHILVPIDSDLAAGVRRSE